TITVTRSADVGEVTVDYATTDGGTATEGEDYTPVSGTLTFAPGQTSNTFSVPIIDDDADESDETVILTLSNPTGAQLGTPVTATLTIVDDDGLPTIRFAQATDSVNEADGSRTITVTLSHPSQSQV